MSNLVERNLTISSVSRWKRLVNVWSLVALALLFFWMAISGYAATGKAFWPIFSLVCTAIPIATLRHIPLRRYTAQGGSTTASDQRPHRG
jgi:hypothetical protein